MRTLAAILLVAGLVWLLVPARGRAEDSQAGKEAAQLFEASCSACHLPADPTFFTDRAWIDQLKDTA